jgi:hypothetical protein
LKTTKVKQKLFFASLLLFFLSIHSISFSQYWQQEVDYTLHVTLNDKSNRLYGDVSFVYTNHSPDDLKEMYIHVWPNAYKNGSSALAKQLEHEGDKALLSKDTTDLGWMENLDFKINGNKAKWNFDPKNPDIVILTFETPLKSGSALTVSTPFAVKIPSGEISRMGHIKQSYQITQWYPKPAVYDAKGWHPIPYLNQGEFYSEFGSFDVSITLPKNYIVGATGVLQNQEEIRYLDSIATATAVNITELIALPAGEIRDSFPVSSTESKTLRYIQNNVHDFAWFADKRFKVLKGEVSLPISKRKVTSWALFTPANALQWQHAIEYINDGTFYYSKWNGDYPYDAVTAVDGTISAGGGMEYPMVTVIGNSSTKEELEVVIVHEVGHNWFYGILGSNEREHGWMDEGMNTANEMRYVQTKYPDNTRMSDMFAGGRLHMNNLDHHDLGDIMYRFMAVNGMDQPIETPSPLFSSANYGGIMYQKTGLVFQYLRGYLGDNLYDQCMQKYYETYKFKHPYPEDMQRIVEGVSGKKLDWLFKDLIQTTEVLDYKISKAKLLEASNTYNVRVKNKGNIRGPIGVSALDKDGVSLETQWTPANEKKSTLTFSNDSKLKEFAIDPTLIIPEINRDNNRIDITKRMFRKAEPLSFEFGIGDHEADKNNVFWMPIMAFNHSDRALLGVAFHNFGIPFKSFQYFFAPMYSFGRNNLGGILEMSKTCFPKHGPRFVKVGLSVKSFGLSEDPKNSTQTFFAAATPYVNLNLVPKCTPRGFSHDLMLKLLARMDEYGFDRTQEYGAKLTHTIGVTRTHFGYQGQVQLEGVHGSSQQVFMRSYVSRVSATQQFSVNYLRKNMERSVKLRLYGAYNLLYNPASTGYNPYGRYDISMFGSAGYQDVFAENYYFNRSSITGYQYNDDMGGFRTASDYLKMSGYWATSTNLTVQLPVKPNIFVAFADFGVYDNGIGVATLYNAGLGINISDVFGLYFPLVQSNSMGDLYSNYVRSVRLTLKLNPFNFPIKVANLLNR